MLKIQGQTIQRFQRLVEVAISWNLEAMSNILNFIDPFRLKNIITQYRK
jgi:hypothetical protein